MLLDLQRPVILKKIEMSYRFESIRFKYVRTTILVLVNAAKMKQSIQKSRIYPEQHNAMFLFIPKSIIKNGLTVMATLKLKQE